MNQNQRWKVKVFILSFILSFALYIFFNYVFYINVHFSSVEVVAPTMGLIFGPIGALGYASARICFDIYTGIPIYYGILRFIFLFLISLLPYKLWYGILRRDNREVLVFSSVFNVLKFIFIVTITSSIITAAYDFSGLLFYYTSYDVITDVPYFLLTVLASSFSMGLIIILDYCNVGFYIPIKDSKYFDDFPLFNYLNKHPNYYNVFLILIIVIDLIIMFPLYFIYGYEPQTYAVLYVILFLLILFLLKPIKKIDINKYKLFLSNSDKKTFSFIESLIIFMVILQSLSVIMIFYLSKLGFLEYVLPVGEAASLIIACSVALFTVCIPFILISLFFESSVFKPIEKISDAVQNYVTKGKLSKDHIEVIEDYASTFKPGTNIGTLARSLVEMNEDLESYIDEVTTLNLENERINTELDVATKIQNTYIPKNFDDFDGLGVNIDGLSVPAREVGGDFFDFFLVDETHIAFSIGDASGKGIPAALFMAISKSLIKQQIFNAFNCNKSENWLGNAYTKINNVLSERNPEKMFITSWVGVLNIETGKLEYINSGHEPPIIKRNGKAKFLNLKSNLVLGILKNYKYELETIFLEKGDRIILYTDGITDANNHSEEFFGSERLLETLNKSNLTVYKELDYLKETVGKFTEDQEQFDDYTILIFEFNKKERN